LWAGKCAGTVERMRSQHEPRQLGLEVQLQAQPIQGRLYDREGDGGLDRAFSGWLGLMSAIEAAAGLDRPCSAARKEAGNEGIR